MSLEKEFEYYLEHQDELAKEHAGKVLAIVGEDVVGVYDTELDAYTDLKTKYEPGTFLLQRCTPGAVEQVFHSRVYFCHENAC
jgi:hypothetical protein